MAEEERVAPAEDLAARVRGWLDREGYPLEFRTLAALRQHKFGIWPGRHVRDLESGTPREIDALGSIDYRIDSDSFLRIWYLIECKWSADKPWVIFSSHRSCMAPSASITQTVASEFGTAALWCIAGNKSLHTLDSYVFRDRCGYGGRRAFSQGQDQFYATIQGVISAAQSLVIEHDDERRPADKLPRALEIAYPVVVVDTDLFEARFNEKTDEVMLQSVDRIRVVWTGSSSRRMLTNVDIVTPAALGDYLAKRRNEADQLAEAVCDAARQIAACFTARDLSFLEVTPGPRGVIGLPPLLRKLRLALESDQKRLPSGEGGVTPGV